MIGLVKATCQGDALLHAFAAVAAKNRAIPITFLENPMCP
jgi:hypothetical protein